MKPSAMTRSAAALLLGVTLLFSAASASAPGIAGSTGNLSFAPTLASGADSGGYATLASKSKSKSKRSAARRRAAAKRRASAKKAKKLVALAKSKLGSRYATAGDGPQTFDCSGFTLYAYRAVGVSLHHYAKSQGFGRGGRVSRSKLRRGDLLFFNTSEARDSVRYHVGIYLGGGSFIHASSSAKKVVIHSIEHGFYRSAFLWGKRLF